MAQEDPYADETPSEPAQDASRTERHPSFIGRIFARRERDSTVDAPQDREVRPKEPQGVAHVPSAVLSVQYVDDGPGMDAALKELEKKLAHLERMLVSIQETTRSLATGFNRQNRDVIQMVESVTRRLDILYRRLGTGGEDAATSGSVVAAPEAPSKGLLEALKEIPPVPEQFADDPEHKRAQRIAKVMASDLEAYNEGKVKEGILYGNFDELLASQIRDARETYLQRVPERVRDEYDYFTSAMSEMIQRKRSELLGENGSQVPGGDAQAGG